MTEFMCKDILIDIVISDMKSKNYKSLNGNLRLVLSDHGFKQLSDPNTTIVYHCNRED